MRRRLVLLAAATTSMVALAFVLPLGLVVRELAEDKALGQAHLEAQALVAALGAVDNVGQRQRIVEAVRQRSPRQVSFFASPSAASSEEGDGDAARIRRAFDGSAFTADYSDGREILLPGVGPDGEQFVVRIRIADRILHGSIVVSWALLALLAVVLSALATAMADRLGRSLVSSVGELVATVRRLGHGDLSARAMPSGPEELVEVADTINNLAERVVVMLAAERQSVGDLSHRLRTPLTALRLEADCLRDDSERSRIAASVDTLSAAVDQLIRAARRPAATPAPRATDVVALVGGRMAYWADRAAIQHRPFSLTTVDGPREVAVDAEALEAAIDALVGNVFAHTAQGTAFAVRIYDSGRDVLIEVSDDGPGIDGAAAPENGARATGSTGLGLDIVRRTVEAAGGSMVIRQPPSGGSTVQTALPLCGRQPALASEKPDAPNPPRVG